MQRTKLTSFLLNKGPVQITSIEDSYLEVQHRDEKKTLVTTTFDHWDMRDEDISWLVEVEVAHCPRYDSEWGDGERQKFSLPLYDFIERQEELHTELNITSLILSLTEDGEKATKLLRKMDFIWDQMQIETLYDPHCVERWFKSTSHGVINIYDPDRGVDINLEVRV